MKSQGFQITNEINILEVIPNNPYGVVPGIFYLCHMWHKWHKLKNGCG